MTKILVTPDLLHRLGNDFEQASRRFEGMDYSLFQSLEPIIAELEVRRKMYIMDQWRAASAELSTLAQVCGHFRHKLHKKAEEFAKADGEDNHNFFENILKKGEEVLHDVRDELAEATNSIFAAATGIADAVHENLTYGLYEGDAPADYENSYLAGKLVGNAITAAGGAVESIAGGGLFSGGVVLDASGVGIAPGVAANALGAGMVVQGVSIAAMGAANFGKDAKDLYSNITEGKGDHSYSNFEIKGEFPNRQYEPSPKHDPQSGWGSPNPIPDNKTGQKLLDTAYSSSKNKQFYNIYEGKIIKFQPDGEKGWHPYEVMNPAKEVPADVLRQFLNDGKITKAEYKKLLKNSK